MVKKYGYFLLSFYRISALIKLLPHLPSLQRSIRQKRNSSSYTCLHPCSVHHYLKISPAKTWMMPSEQIKLSHKFPQNTTLAHLLFFDSLSIKCGRRRGNNVCHYSRVRHDHARTHTHFHALTAYPKSMVNNGKTHQNLWRTMENRFMWS